MLQEKKKTEKNPVCGICTDVKVKLIKTRQRDRGLLCVCALLSGYRALDYSRPVGWGNVGSKIHPNETSEIRFGLRLLFGWRRGLQFLTLEQTTIIKPLSVNSH